MNRRNFIGGLFEILPAAICYKRIWKEIAKTEMPEESVINPEWVNAQYEVKFYYSIDLASVENRNSHHEAFHSGNKKILIFKREATL